MAKLIPYDVTNVEDSGGGTGVKVKPGVHVARIVKCAQRTERKDGTPANDIEVALDVGAEFDWVFTYIGLSEAADWKLKEFINAVGLKAKGNIDTDKLVGKIIRVKINSGTWEGQYSPDAGRLMKAQPGDEDLIGQGVSEMSSKTEDGPDADDDTGGEATGDNFYREGLPDPESPDDIVGSYDDWSDEDLLAEVEDRGLSLPGGRGAKKVKAITALRDDDAAVAGADDGDGDDDAASGEDDYDDWDIDKLKQEWEERNMGDLPAVRGRGAADRLKDAMITALREDDIENPFEP